jgi:hypothetical protein
MDLIGVTHPNAHQHLSRSFHEFMELERGPNDLILSRKDIQLLRGIGTTSGPSTSNDGGKPIRGQVFIYDSCIFSNDRSKFRDP